MKTEPKLSLMEPKDGVVTGTYEGDGYSPGGLDYSLDGMGWMAAPSLTLSDGKFTFRLEPPPALNDRFMVRDHSETSITAIWDFFPLCYAR